MSYSRRLWIQGQQNNDSPADKPQIKNLLGKIGQEQPRPIVMEMSREEFLRGSRQAPIAFPNSGGNMNMAQMDSTQPIPRLYNYNIPRPMGVRPYNLIRSAVPNAVLGNPNVRSQCFEGPFRNIRSMGLSMSPQATAHDLNGNINLLNSHQISNPMFMRNPYAGTNNIPPNWAFMNVDGREVDGSRSFRLMGHQLKIKENAAAAAFPYNHNANANGIFKVPAARTSNLGDHNMRRSAQRYPMGRATPPATRMTPSYRMSLRKKVALNNFPSNVKSLLMSGLFDGIPVKYISWSRKENLRGIIKSSGYLCGCSKCEFKNVVNAYEFEIHAGCQTKHPNNHIYFQNGKTIYDVVRELKDSTPYTIFHTIKTVTGSPINMKIFRMWKGKYVSATHNLMKSSRRE